MTPLITQLTTALRYASKGIIRDYSELEHLQSSNRGTQAFVAKAYGRIKSALQYELSKIEYSTIQFTDHPKLLDQEGIHLIINPLEGLNNLNKALPFFGTVITVVKFEHQQIIPIATAVNLPASGEVLYAEKSQGAWLEKISMQSGNTSARLRCSAVKTWDDAIINLLQLSDASLFTKFRAPRIFGSTAYALAQYAAGKLDAIILNKTDLASFYAAQLISVECGGKSYTLTQKSDYLLVTNLTLPNLS